ncbi:PRX5 [Auxenochlorella protothecoides x Auxenochlorella symbiontica]
MQATMQSVTASVSRFPAARGQLGRSRAPRSFSGNPLPRAQGRASARRSVVSVSALAVGDKLPQDINLSYFDAEGNMQETTVGALTKGKKVVFVAVPGAFTPTCSSKHVPGFINSADKLKAKGVDTIGCISVNDAFVMAAWAKQLGADGKILMLADGSGNFTKAVGAELDLSDKGLGHRSRRYSMLADDGVVKLVNMEEGGAFTVSSADDILKQL